MGKKYKILYAEDLEDLREVYAMTLEAQLSCEVVEFSCGNDLIEYLKKDQNVSLILCDHNMPNGNGSDVYRFVKQNGIKVPFGLLSSDPPSVHSEFKDFLKDHPLNFSALKPFDIPKMMLDIKKSLGESGSTVLPEYVPIKMERFERFNPLAVDLHILTDDQKFVKYLSKGEMFSAEYHGKKQLKHGKFFYIKKDQYIEFINFCIVDLKNFIKSSTNLSESMIKGQLSGLELIHQMVKIIGIDEKTIEVVDAITSLVLKNLKSDSTDLADLIAKISAKKGFLSEHSLLMSYLSCGIAKICGWGSDDFFQKFVNASLLHDVLLDDRLSVINHQTEIVDQNLSFADSMLVTEHPLKTFEMLQKTGKFSQEELQIIMSHHERPNGSGFPKGLNANNTPPMACLFILTSVFVSKIIHEKPNKEIFLDAYKELEVEYSVGNYKRFYVALGELLGC